MFQIIACLANFFTCLNTLLCKNNCISIYVQNLINSSIISLNYLIIEMLTRLQCLIKNNLYRNQFRLSRKYNKNITKIAYTYNVVNSNSYYASRVRFEISELWYVCSSCCQRLQSLPFGCRGTVAGRRR